MSTSIDQVFSKQFESEVHLAYQRQGSKLRGTVRTKSGVRGSSTFFPKAGKGEATTKARHGLVPTMNVDHSQVECILYDKYAGDWIDSLDELKTNIDERMVLTNTVAYAMGRATDSAIITQLDLATNSTAALTSGEAAFRNSVLRARQALLERDVPYDGKLFAAISPSVEAWLLTVEQFASADYVGPALPYDAKGGGVRTWLGFNWITHTGLPKSGNNRSVYFYHSSAVGHAIQQDVKTDISWHGDRQAWFVAGSLAMGAALIDNDGIQKLTLDESLVLPTS